MMIKNAENEHVYLIFTTTLYGRISASHFINEEIKSHRSWKDHLGPQCNVDLCIILKTEFIPPELPSAALKTEGENLHLYMRKLFT